MALIAFIRHQLTDYESRFDIGWRWNDSGEEFFAYEFIGSEEELIEWRQQCNCIAVATLNLLRAKYGQPPIALGLHSLERVERVARTVKLRDVEEVEQLLRDPLRV